MDAMRIDSTTSENTMAPHAGYTAGPAGFDFWGARDPSRDFPFPAESLPEAGAAGFECLYLQLSPKRQFPFWNQMQSPSNLCPACLPPPGDEDLFLFPLLEGDLLLPRPLPVPLVFLPIPFVGLVCL